MIATEEQIKKARSLGVVGYNAYKCALILEITEQEFKDSKELQTSYERGKLESELKIDLKLFELACNGDLAALKEYQKRKMNNL